MLNTTATDSPDTELLSTSGAARILGISEGAVRNWANSGKLPTRRTFGTGIRLYERQVVERLAEIREDRQVAERLAEVREGRHAAEQLAEIREDRHTIERLAAIREEGADPPAV